MAPLRPLAIGLSAGYAKRLAGCTRTTRVSRSRPLIGVPPAKHAAARTSTVASTARSPQGVCGPCDVCPAPAVPLGDPIRHRGPTRLDVTVGAGLRRGRLTAKHVELMGEQD